MKPPTVFLGEMTNREVEAFLRRATTTVIVPTGSTEQHGPHGPLLTDVLVPNEVAAAWRRRSAPRSRRRSTTGCRIRTRASPASSTPRIPTFMALVEDVAVAGDDRVPADRVPQRPLRQHARDRLRLRERGRPPARRRRARSRSTTGTGMTAEEAAEFFGPTDRAPREQGRDVGGDGDQRRPRRHRRRERRDAAVPRGRPTRQPSTPRSSSRTRARSTARRTAARGATPASRSAEFGERYLEVVTEATIRMLEDIERTFAAMPRALGQSSYDPGPGAHHPAHPGLASSSTRSARWPIAIRPRSAMPSSASGLRLAAATAAGNGTPAATRLRTAVSRAMTDPASVSVPGQRCSASRRRSTVELRRSGRARRPCPRAGRRRSRAAAGRPA